MEQKLYSYKGIFPTVDDDTAIFAGARVIGKVTLAKGVSIWHNAVLRGDVSEIQVGEFSNIQDNSTVHCGLNESNPDGIPTIIGKNVTVGHNCTLHSCTIEDGCLIGMNATVLDGAIIGKGSTVGAGTLVLGGMKIPPFSLVVGVPGRVVKTIPEDSLAEKKLQAEFYYKLANEYTCDSDCVPNK